MKATGKIWINSYVAGVAVLLMAVGIILGSVALASAQTRIVVVPFYTEEGIDAKDHDYVKDQYRRMMRFINNQLTRHGFEVLNAFAREATEEEYNRVMERAREDSPLAAKEVCKKYATEIAYIVWLTVKTQKTPDGYCKAKASVDGEGYDSAGRDLGAGVYKSFIVTRRDCDDAVAEAEKEIGDLVGRRLTAWDGERNRSGAVSGNAGSAGSVTRAGVVENRSKGLENLIEVRLDGGTEYTHTEVFGKVINTVRGVVEAKRYASTIIPDNPQACYAIWRVRIEDTDPFRLQANVIKMIHDILEAGGEITINGVPYRYTPAEVDLLKGIRPGDTTSRSIQFVIDRELARDKEFSGRHDPYKAKEKK